MGKVIGSIMRLFIYDFVKKPSLSYVYESMWRVAKGINKLFKNKRNFCGPYIDIINNKWDNMLKKDLRVVIFC